MMSLDQIFTYYDRIIGAFPEKGQVLVSVLLLALIVWSFIAIFKHGHWIFIAIFIILFPGGWPASLRIVDAIWAIAKFLFIRSAINL